jgi:predicted GNAT family acetyltransferase
MADPTVRDNPELHRYELTIDDEVVGVADYRLQGDVMVFPHTEIERSHQGGGLGAILVGRALDDVRAQGRTIVPACWYVAQFVEEHPDYRDLIAP